MSETAPTRLSVVIVTYNSRDAVERSLPPLVAQLRETDELIVIDNASTDGSPAAVRRLAPTALVAEIPRTSGSPRPQTRAPRSRPGT